MAGSHKERTLQELVQRLKELSQTQTEGALKRELKELVYELKSSRLRHPSSAHVFCEEGGLHPLLKLLSQCACVSPDPKDGVLLCSLLGNVSALDKGCRDTIMAMESTVATDIIGILRTGSHPDLLNTAARLVANLAIDHTHIPTLQSIGVVSALTNILIRGLVTDTCKRSLLRAVRIFASSVECREEVKSCDGIPAIVECLQSQDSEVALSAIQTLLALTQDYDSDIVALLCNKTAMRLILRYCNHSEGSIRESSMNLLLNSAKTSDGRVALSSAGGVEILVGFMETYIDKLSVLLEVVSAACLCCRDVISRQRLRDCGGLERLISMLGQERFVCLHGNILSALVCYYFDETTLQTMVKEMGLLKALVFHLKNMVDQGECKVHSGVEEEQPMDVTERFPLVSDVEFDWSVGPGTSLSDSPHSVTSDPVISKCVECLSLDSKAQETPPVLTEDLPVITPPPAKKPRLELDLDGLNPLPPNFLDSLLSSSSPYKPDRKPPDSLFSNETTASLDSQVILLLSRVSHLRECLSSLSAPDILSAILDYFVSTDPPNAHVFKVLTRVFMNPHCFQDILLTLVPSKLFKQLQEQCSLSIAPYGSHAPVDSPIQTRPLSTLQELSVVSVETKFRPMYEELSKRLSKVAESPYGQGVLAHMLLRGGEKEKQASCLSIPMLCRSVRVCKKMMLSYGGFQELRSLAASENDLQYMALESLLVLAVNSQQAMPIKRQAMDTSCISKNPMTLPDESPLAELACRGTIVSCDRSCDRRHPLCRYLDTDHYPFDLTITVHGPEGGVARVPVHKSVLIESSDVFRVMLQGEYSEAASNEVSLKDLPPLAFVSLVHYIYGCGWQCPDVFHHRLSGAPHEPTDGLSTLATRHILESVTSQSVGSEQGKRAEHCLLVLACARRFLLTELSTICQHAAVEFMTPSNVVAMFHFARIHQCFCLSESCIRVVMAMNHCQLRTDVFRDLVMSYEGKAVLDMLRLFISMA